MMSYMVSWLVRPFVGSCASVPEMAVNLRDLCRTAARGTGGDRDKALTGAGLQTPLPFLI